MVIMAARMMPGDSRVTMSSHTLKLHTKAHPVRGRTTLKNVERFRNGSVHELYERQTYDPTLLSEPSIENYAISNKLSNVSLKSIHEKHVIVNQVEYPYELWNVWRTRAESLICLFTKVFVRHPNHLNCIVMWKLENKKIKLFCT